MALPRLASNPTYLRETEEKQLLPADFDVLCSQVTAPSPAIAGAEHFRSYALTPLLGALLVHLITGMVFRVKFPLVLSRSQGKEFQIFNFLSPGAEHGRAGL